MTDDISTLKGQILTSVVQNGVEEIIFTSETGTRYRMYHDQDCCEKVTIEDVCGDLTDLIGSEIVLAEERSNSGDLDDGVDSCTWTFYVISSGKGSVTIRWYGESNGYYSERVDFEEMG